MQNSQAIKLKNNPTPRIQLLVRPSPFVPSKGMESPKEVGSPQTSSHLYFQHLVARCDVFKDFQFCQEVVRELHVSNALVKTFNKRNIKLKLKKAEWSHTGQYYKR